MTTDPDPIGQLANWRISTLVCLSSGMSIALATASLVIVGHIASREADTQASLGEQRLHENALQDRFLRLARDRLTVARWSRSVEGRASADAA